MFTPRYVISNKLLRTIGSIEASKEIIETSSIDSEAEKKMLDEIIAKKIYFGSHIEGNNLTFNQTKQILEGPTQVAQNRDVQEIINYRRAFNMIEELSLASTDYLPDWLRDIHAALTYNILPPEKAGFFRSNPVIMRDPDTAEVIFTPPQAAEIPELISEFFTWLNSPDARDIHPVIRASISILVLLIVHPFVEGNSAVARFFGGLILEKEGYSIKHLLLLEEQMNVSIDDFLSTVWDQEGQALNSPDRDLTPVIESFAEIVAASLLTLKEEVKKLSVRVPARAKVSADVALSARQIRIIDFVSENGRAVMKELKTIIPNVSEDTILRDLTVLAKKGIIEKEGTTKASSYVLKK